MNTNRVFALILEDGADNAAAVTERLRLVPDSDVVAFSADGRDGSEKWPDGLDTAPKFRNWINGRFADSGFSGFLHVLDVRQIDMMKDPSGFVSDLERMMRVLDYPVWLNTATDALNRVYAKYSPSMTIQIDSPGVAESTGLAGTVCVTSHSNVNWIVYDFGRLRGSDLLRFDEDFSVPMFYIVELLARRRNTAPGGSLYFMNEYFTVESEAETFRLRKAKGPADDPEQFKAENALWAKKNINARPDCNIDVLLERFWEKLKPAG